MLISSKNLLHENVPKTYLTSSGTAGSVIFNYANSAGFNQSWAIQIGEVGEENTEVKILSAATPHVTIGTSTAALTFNHPVDTPIYGIKYDQVVFERSTDGTAGTATPMTNGTVTYQADSAYTVFDDTSGSSTYGYRTFFRSSALSTNTTESDWLTSGGFSFYSLARIRQRTVDKMWNSDFLTPDVIDNWTNEFKDNLNNAAIQANEDYSLGTVGVGFGTDGLGTVTTGDFRQPRRVWVTYNGNDRFQSTKQDVNDDFPNRNYISTHPYHYWLGNDVVKVDPAESGGTAEIVFYRSGTPLVNDTDELPRFMRSYTDGFVNYNLLQAKYKDGKISITEKMALEQTLVKDFVGQLAPRDKSSSSYINMVEPTTGDDFLP